MRAIWDLDHIRKTNRWELLVGEPDQKEKALFEDVIGRHSGTLVLWSQVDRLLKNYSKPDGVAAKKALSRISEGLEEHISLVFQRFLDTGDSRAPDVTMRLNGKELEPWDPFCVKSSEVVIHDEPEVELQDGQRAGFSVTAYVLPRKEEFNSAEAAKAARITNANQGIYVYRENRLIHGPDWLKMFSKEPHLSLLRVEFNFDHRLDEAFQIDIKKSQIILNEVLYDHILELLNPPRRAAEKVYRKGRNAVAAGAAQSAHDSSNRNISSVAKDIPAPMVQSANSSTGEAELINTQGHVKLKLKITSAAKPLEVHVQPTEAIDDGLLWEPCLIDQKLGVRINTSHPYYQKVYLPNLAAGVTIQGMDALLWGLSVAELNCVSESTRTLFGELRYEVSRNLRKLVQDLPDPEASP